MDVRLPDGTVVTNVPEGTTQSQLMAQVAKSQGRSVNEQVRSKTIPAFEVEARNPASGYNAGEQLFAGMGKGMVDATRGVAQLFGGGPSPQEMDDIKRRDKSLSGSGAGGVGNFLGGAAAYAPAAFIPGVNTVLGGAAAGGLMGLAQPVGTKDSRGTNAVAGAAFGGSLPLAFKGAEAGGRLARNLIDPALPGGMQRAQGRLLNEGAGSDREEIIRLLRRSKEHVQGSAPIAGEAAAPAGRAEFNAIGESVRGRAPTEYARRTDEQNLSRLKEIGTVAKTSDEFNAASAVRDANSKQNYGAVRDNLVDPRSEAQIMQDAINAKGGAASQSVEDVRRLERAKQLAEKGAQNWFPVEGQPRAPGRYSYQDELAGIAERKSGEAASSSLQSGAERRYLEDFRRMLGEADNLNTQALDSFLSRPSVQDAVQKAFMGAKETGAYFPKQGEQFSVGNLQRIKMAIADELDKPEVVKALGKTERAEVGNTLSQFVGWLSDKSPEWKKARLTFAEDSVPMNRMQIGQYLESVLKPSGWQAGAGGQPLNTKGYIEALRKSTDVGDTVAARRAASVVQKRGTGTDRYPDLPEAMGPQMDPLNNILADVLRSESNKGLAGAGKERAGEILGKSVKELPPSGMFSPLLSVSRGIANRALGKASETMRDDLAKKWLHPNQIADLMELSNPQRAKAIADLLRASQIPLTGGATGMLGDQQ